MRDYRSPLLDDFGRPYNVNDWEPFIWSKRDAVRDGRHMMQNDGYQANWIGAEGETPFTEPSQPVKVTMAQRTGDETV